MTVNYLKDILQETLVPEKFNASPGNAKTLIVDFGSWQCRAGWSEEASPSCKLLFDIYF